MMDEYGKMFSCRLNFTKAPKALSPHQDQLSAQILTCREDRSAPLLVWLQDRCRSQCGSRISYAWDLTPPAHLCWNAIIDMVVRIVLEGLSDPVHETHV